MATKGQELPFDINVIRTIFYNVGDARDVHKAVLGLQAVVDRMVEQGFATTSGGDSLSSVMETLNRIERKVSGFSANAPTTFSMSTPFIDGGIDDPVASGQLSIREAFELALRQENLAYAEKLLPRIKASKSEDVYFEDYVERLAFRGSRVAGEELVGRLPSIHELPIERCIETIGCLVSYFNQHDEESRGIDLLFPIIDGFVCNSQIDDKSKASLLNQKQKLLFGLSPDDHNYECIQLLKRAVALDPEEKSYLYNLAFVFADAERYEEAYEQIVKCMQLSEQSDRFDMDHVTLAIRLTKRLGKSDEYARWIKLLQEKSPYKFQYMQTTGQLKPLVTS